MKTQDVRRRVVPQRQMVRFVSDHTRVITRLFQPGPPAKVRRILERALSMSDAEVADALDQVMRNFSHRHRDFADRLLLNADQVPLMLRERQPFDQPAPHNPDDGPDLSDLDRDRRMLLGAYFTSEYAVEAAAFFNPSIVPHPRQSGLPHGVHRFILSFRAAGEGHISSIVFRTGTIDTSNKIAFDPVSRFVETPRILPNPGYDKPLFVLKLREMGFDNPTARAILDPLDDEFSLHQLVAAIDGARDRGEAPDGETIRTIRWLADSNYELHFSPDQPISECVIYPVSANEVNGIEDARFVRFVDDDGSVTYYATYTAYNGVTIMPQMIETEDFHHFRIITLNGDAVKNKGMALFPRRVGGNYMMITRHDGENLYLATSDDVHFWYVDRLLQVPAEPWELIQIGNCGSPVETEAGWLLITHGVGAMRQYCIGAMLLDRDDPARVIARLREPLLFPDEMEREGYVPNVVYSCGAMIHNDQLILPYAMSDMVSGIAMFSLPDLLQALKESPA